ncbi:MAG: shikimate dehydrogenase [Actinomycetota bacterium]|nr:shikimate dehydrogenase [Actinomycetota bacterium]
MKIYGSTSFTGIIGYPIEHTLSPSFQNAAFERAGLNWVYLPFKVEPDRLEISFAGLAAAGCRGLNVTMPHKQAVFTLVDEAAESAAVVKAVNTVEFKGGRSIGHNTDGLGFVRSLKSDAAFDPVGKKVLVIGAGGAAQSIALALAKAGAGEMKILNRTRKKAETIVGLVRSYYAGSIASIADMDDSDDIRSCDLVVNATSVGMATNPGLPLGLDLLRPGQVVYDIIYWPAETEFLRLAKAGGARTVNGAGMLLYQGAAAFTIWTGLPAPIEEMAQALRAELRDRGTEDIIATNKHSARTNIIRHKTDNPGTTG